MTTEETTTSSTIYAEITVANFHHIGSSTTTRAIGTTMPCPAVIRDDTSPTRSEGIPLTVTLCKCRGVVDIRCTNLRMGSSNNSKCRQECM